MQVCSPWRQRSNSVLLLQQHATLNDTQLRPPPPELHEKFATLLLAKRQSGVNTQRYTGPKTEHLRQNHECVAWALGPPGSPALLQRNIVRINGSVALVEVRSARFPVGTVPFRFVPFAGKRTFTFVLLSLYGFRGGSAHPLGAKTDVEFRLQAQGRHVGYDVLWCRWFQEQLINISLRDIINAVNRPVHTLTYIQIHIFQTKPN